jgi:hypothetical protein
MATVDRIDVILSTLNATDVGSLDSIAEKLRQVKDELQALAQAELVARLDLTLLALERGDLAEFRRGRAYLQSKVGHLR